MPVRAPNNAVAAISFQIRRGPSQFVPYRSFPYSGVIAIPLAMQLRRASTQTISSSKRLITASPKPPIIKPRSSPNQIIPLSRSSSNPPAFAINPNVNPPESTRPAPLSIPTRKPDQGTFSYYFAYGRAYLRFYKTGLKNVYANFKLVLAIKRRIGANPSKQLLNRTEFQLLRRNRHDAARVPVFLLLFCIFGEFLPVIMTIFKSRITPVIPYTCRLPSQIEAERAKLLKKRETALQKCKGVEPDQLSQAAYMRYAAEFFGLQKPLLPLSWQRTSWLARSVEQHLYYIRQDNAFLAKDGGVVGLNDDEVILAAVDRGLWDPEAPVHEIRRRLDKNVRDAAEFEAKIEEQELENMKQSQNRR